MSEQHEQDSNLNYSSMIYASLPFVVRRWWRREPGEPSADSGGAVTGGAWRMQSDPRCDPAEVDYPDLL